MRSRKISLAVLAAVALVACGSKDLTKDEAREVLLAQPNFVSKKVQIAPVLAVQAFKRFEQDGYVTIATSGLETKATPTAKLEPYLVGPAKTDGGTAVVVVRVAKTSVQEVTGIAPVAGDPATKVVEYTVKVMPTPVAGYVGARKTEVVSTRKAYFTFRDGEWRLKRTKK